MSQINFKKRVVSISIIAAFLFTGVILFFSLSNFNDKKDSDTLSKTVSSDSVPGENNSEIKPEMTPREIEGYYIDDSDGWYYDFKYAPNETYHGTFSAGYDQSHHSVSDNPQKNYTASGMWTLTNGEIKLYNDVEYQQSMWACGSYIVDSQNYFVGSVPENKDTFQAVFICKAIESGDSQILNFYSDGKLIMEIIRNDGHADTDMSTQLPPYQLVAGTYKITNDKITTEINGASQEFYITDDGLAKWVYRKK